MTDLLSVENLSMSFGGLHALKNISLKLKANTITGLIGPNGAGKTTLFNCLTGFYRAHSGHVHFKLPAHSVDLLHLMGGAHAITQLGIVRTFQHSRVFREMTVIENLLVAKHRHQKNSFLSGLLHFSSYRLWEQQAIDSAFSWLKKFNLENDANRLAGELSYGTQKRLEIARAMCTDPLLLCLDEPAAGLNAMETQALSELLVTLQQEHNLTIMLIEHDMSFVMGLCHHVIVLDYGEVISQGTPMQVRQDKKVIDAYLGQ